MDPLTGVAVAGNILQFAQFALGLFKAAHKIYAAKNGQAGEEEHFEGIHARLVTLRDLMGGTTVSPTHQTGVITCSFGYSDVLESLLAECQGHCEKLLDICRRIQVNQGGKGKFWKSFEKALYDIWKKEDVDHLKNRIAQCQTEIATQLCVLSTDIATRSSAQVEQLITECVLNRSERLDQFDQLDGRLKAICREIGLISRKVLTPDQSSVAKPFDDYEMKTLTTRVSQLAILENKLVREEKILTSLNFDQRPFRHNAIVDAHSRTFEWALSRGTGHSPPPASNAFVDWLESGEGIFWISGKPGSGKSTLMKFLTRQDETMRLLSTWSRSTRVIVASHFFWSAGSPMQRSREGLARTLLYNVLSQTPEAISAVLKYRFERVDPDRLASKPWSPEELQSAVQSLASQQNLNSNFCFFIDGLDEFEGDSVDICQALVTLCSSKHIKLCISSRPWNVFESYLGQTPHQKMYVPDLTTADIHIYVESELQSCSRFSDSIADDVQLSEFIKEVTTRAQGVFLWVFLVTRLLREGLMNHDSISDLWKRLDSIPTDLELFFKHILESVELFYHEKQANTLQIALAGDGPIPSVVYCFHEREYSDENYALTQFVIPMSPAERIKLERPVFKRLNARCKGLLEIRRHEVDFLHRTVRDFLYTREMTAFLRENGTKDFNPHLSLFRGYLARLKTGLPEVNFRDCLGTMLRHAYAVDSLPDDPSQPVMNSLLDDLELAVQIMVMAGHVDSPGPNNNSGGDNIEEVESWFRGQLVRYDLAHYLSVNLTRHQAT